MLRHATTTAVRSSCVYCQACCSSSVRRYATSTGASISQSQGSSSSAAMSSTISADLNGPPMAEAAADAAKHGRLSHRKLKQLQLQQRVKEPTSIVDMLGTLRRRSKLPMRQSVVPGIRVQDTRTQRTGKTSSDKTVREKIDNPRGRRRRSALQSARAAGKQKETPSQEEASVGSSTPLGHDNLVPSSESGFSRTPSSRLHDGPSYRTRSRTTVDTLDDGEHDGSGGGIPILRPPAEYSLDPTRAPDTSLPTISSLNVSISKVSPLAHAPVATLAHGLEGVLFQPGIHWLQDPSSGVYNFPKELQTIMSKDEFDFNQLPSFIPPSRDPDLQELLRRSGRKFAGSTSSLTSAMSHIYFALNGKKPLNTQTKSFTDEPRTFTAGIQLPATIVLTRTDDGNYLIDNGKNADPAPDAGSTAVGPNSSNGNANASATYATGANILSLMGNVLEKFLTYPTQEFRRFSRRASKPFAPEESRMKREAYHYAATSDLLMRSQLDCHDPRLPKGTFDIKTRATVAIRRDVLNHAQGAGYAIDRLAGPLSSFERERYDLVRSAFLKYAFQARIGDMDGIFLAYHSTERIFGFEYLPIEEMDKTISGSHEESTQAFHLCVGLLEAVLKRAVADIPDQSLKLSFDGKDGNLHVLAAPHGDDSARPLKLYDIQLTSFLNGIEVPSGESVDFLSHPSRRDTTTPASSSTAPSPHLAEAAAEVQAQKSPSDAAQQPINWTVAYDIAYSEDEAFNAARLRRLRRKQRMFSRNVLLPEGLSRSEIERALKNRQMSKKQQSEPNKSEDQDQLSASEAVLAQENTVEDVKTEPSGTSRAESTGAQTNASEAMPTEVQQEQAGTSVAEDSGAASIGEELQALLVQTSGPSETSDSFEGLIADQRKAERTKRVDREKKKKQGFVPVPGVSYVIKPGRLIKQLRLLAQQGRERQKREQRLANANRVARRADAKKAAKIAAKAAKAAKAKASTVELAPGTAGKDNDKGVEVDPEVDSVQELGKAKQQAEEDRI